jgi:hypothetical protein
MAAASLLAEDSGLSRSLSRSTLWSKSSSVRFTSISPFALRMTVCLSSLSSAPSNSSRP